MMTTSLTTFPLNFDTFFCLPGKVIKFPQKKTKKWKRRMAATGRLPAFDENQSEKNYTLDVESKKKYVLHL